MKVTKFKLNQSGDTIIEVLLATVIISSVLAASYALTNRATRLNQTAVERTTVSNLMREQVEIIRSARTSGADHPLWLDVISKLSTASPNYGNCEPSSGVSAFYVTASSSSTSIFNLGPPVADAHDDLFSIWVEAYDRSTPGISGRYVDLHVRACWEGIGGEAEQRSAIVMRLAR